MSLQALLDTGIAYHLKGELTVALAYYGAVVNVDPDNAVANYNISRVFQEREYQADLLRGEN